jgi:hypothetical protein
MHTAVSMFRSRNKTDNGNALFRVGCYIPINLQHIEGKGRTVQIWAANSLNCIPGLSARPHRRAVPFRRPNKSISHLTQRSRSESSLRYSAGPWIGFVEDPIPQINVPAKESATTWDKLLQTLDRLRLS